MVNCFGVFACDSLYAGEVAGDCYGTWYLFPGQYDLFLGICIFLGNHICTDCDGIKIISKSQETCPDRCNDEPIYGGRGTGRGR